MPSAWYAIEYVWCCPNGMLLHTLDAVGMINLRIVEIIQIFYWNFFLPKFVHSTDGFENGSHLYPICAGYKDIA